MGDVEIALNVGVLLGGSGTHADATTVDGHDGFPDRISMLYRDVLVVDERFWEAIETAVIVHEAACTLIGDDGAIGQGALGWGVGGGDDRL